MEDVEEGVKVGGELLKDVKFADNQGMVAHTEKGENSFPTFTFLN